MAHRQTLHDPEQSTNYRRGAASSPDVTLLKTSRAHLVNWKVLDSIGSDHLPLLISTDQKTQERRPSKRLNYKKTDWDVYKQTWNQLCSIERPEQSLDKDCKQFTEIILQAAKKSNPSSSGKASKPWWNGKCAAAKRERNQELRKLRTSRTEEAISIYQQARLDLEKTIITEKGESWKTFASELTPSIPSTKARNTMKAMDGRSRSNLTGIPIIEDGKERATDREKAEPTVKAYARVSRLKVERVHEKDAYDKVRRAVTVISMKKISPWTS